MRRSLTLLLTLLFILQIALPAPVMSILAKTRQLVKLPKRVLDNFWFAYKHKHLRHQHKIVYTLTPPPHLKNVGDQAQVIAINAWLKRHFSHLPVMEMDKDRVKYFLPALQWLVQPADIVFLHSGGNLGDRGIWSESIRRAIILAFPKNQIISLPQTIYFSDTPTGEKEREKTRSIYATHSHLTVIGRDLRSGELAAQLFPHAQTFCMPDFVLSLPPSQPQPKNNPPQVLLCLRLDDESALTAQQRQEFSQRLPYHCTYYDTTIDEAIAATERNAVLERTLDLFRAADVVVTDRYHGLIFSILCCKPCVVLRTVDHKLTSAMYWFKDVSFVTFARDVADVPALVENSLAISNFTAPNWNAEYFDKIPALVGLA